MCRVELRGEGPILDMKALSELVFWPLWRYAVVCLYVDKALLYISGLNLLCGAVWAQICSDHSTSAL